MQDKYIYTPTDATSYSDLGIQGTTYQMAYEEVARMLGNLSGKKVLDFGSGTGRSSRFLSSLGPEAVAGVDHNESMIVQARARNIENIRYHLIDRFLPFDDSSFDAALSIYAFPEMPNLEAMQEALTEIARVLRSRASFVLVIANPGAFGHDFVSYSRTGNPNSLKSGVKTDCNMKGERPYAITDIYWTEADYRNILVASGFELVETSFPKPTDGTHWLDEKIVAPDMVIKARKI